MRWLRRKRRPPPPGESGGGGASAAISPPPPPASGEAGSNGVNPSAPFIRRPVATTLLTIGVATVAAIVSGLAPGRLALTVMVGKSTCGNGDTGSSG